RVTAGRLWTRRPSAGSPTSRRVRSRRGSPSIRSRMPCGAAGNIGRGRRAARNCWRISRIGGTWSRGVYDPEPMETLLSLMLHRAGLAALCLIAAAASARADAVADFYKGKTLTLIAGFPPGGGYDTSVRILTPHYAPSIPLHP